MASSRHLHDPCSSRFNIRSNQGSPPEDDSGTGVVRDFPGVIANSSTTVYLNPASLIDGSAQPATRSGPCDIVFVRFDRTVVDALFQDGFEGPIVPPQ